MSPATLVGGHESLVGRPDKMLVVKCTFDKLHKRITFNSARNCSYELLRRKVEQCFTLSAMSYAIAYKDDDGEVTDITTDTDLTEAIQYFQGGADDAPVSSASSILSGRSFGNRKITLRVQISVDYDGPSLSDTSSLVSMDEYKFRNGSELSFSLGGGSQGPVDDDSVTVSSRDTRGLSQPAVTRHTAEGSISLSDWEEETSYVASKSQGSRVIISNHPPNVDNPFSDVQSISSSEFPADHPSAVFTRLKLHEESIGVPTAYEPDRALHEDERGAAWLRDQNARTIKSMLGVLPAPSESEMQTESDEPSLSVAASNIDGGLALQRDPRGKYYYSYTASSPAVSQAYGHDGGAGVGYDTSPSPIPSSSTNRPAIVTSSSDPVTVRAAYPDIPPELLQFLPAAPAPPPPQDEVTECSSCGTVLDLLRYVCSTCGPRKPRAQLKAEAENGFEKGKGRASPGSLNGDDGHSAYPPQRHRTPGAASTFYSSPTLVGSEEPLLQNHRPYQHPVSHHPYQHHQHPRHPRYPHHGPHHGQHHSPDLHLHIESYPPGATLPMAVPGPYSSSPHSPASASSSTLSAPSVQRAGYELCAGCIEAVGVMHALDANAGVGVGAGGRLGSPGTSVGRSGSGSGSGGSGHSSSVGSTPSSPEETQRALSQWRRAAPRLKGQIRHAFLEKVWGPQGWEDVEHDDGRSSKCSTCNTANMHPRYKCASCQKFNLCRACYSQVHEVHPSHVFLEVRDKPARTMSEPDLHDATAPELENSDEPSLKHPGVKCAHCLQDIVGARFHCAICEAVDICSNCESAGLPGNLDSTDGGHNSSHIMIKIPLPLETTKVQTMSRQAAHLWTGRDATTEAVPKPRSRANSTISGYARTVIGSNTMSSRGAPTESADDHHVLCDSCDKVIIGVRYQCANCPSSPTAFNLCAACEPRSFLIHDSMHIFFKITRPVHRALQSAMPFLPVLYTTPAGPPFGQADPAHPKEYLRTLVHNRALCDRCMTRIQGEWFRCAYCPTDLCDACEAVDTHDHTHIFMVFKSTVDMVLFRRFAEVDSPGGGPPVIPYPIYLA